MSDPWSQPGEAYWSWHTALAMAPYAMVALVWADGQGQHKQDTLWDGAEGEGGETYWPCIIAVCAPDGQDRVPFYCPALAWMGSRPWFVHISRLRMVPRQWYQDQLIDFGDGGLQFPFLPMTKL